jgi:hypothetical protein
MNFNLSSLALREVNIKSTDAVLSFKALIEGDATLIITSFISMKTMKQQIYPMKKSKTL